MFLMAPSALAGCFLVNHYCYSTDTGVCVCLREKAGYLNPPPVALVWFRDASVQAMHRTHAEWAQLEGLSPLHS